MTDIVMNGYIAREIEMAKAGVIDDGEALGLDDEGRIIFWDNEAQKIYVTGDTPESYGVENLGMLERDRLERDGWRLGAAPEIVGPAP